MKKWLKKILKFFGIFIGVLIILSFFSISFIDTTPYFETNYYKNTTKKLNGVLSERNTYVSKLLAGFAKINITPKIVSGTQNPSKGEFNEIKLAGFGDGQLAAGAHDSIYAKAIVLNVDGNLTVLISADLLFIPPEVVQSVEKKIKTRSKITRDKLFFGATHTHASIGNCVPKFAGKIFGGKYQPEVIEWLAEKFAQLIINASSDLQPSEIANGYVQESNLITNRIVGSAGRLNDKLTIMSIKQLQGKSAVIGYYAAHPTVMDSNTNKFSADYPGYFQRHMEKNGVDMAMFFAGAMGSHAFTRLKLKGDLAEYIGVTLADSALKVLKRIKYTDTVTISTITSEIEIPKLQAIYIADNLRLSPQVAQLLLPEIKPIYLQAILLNDFLWIAMPCELSGEYAIDLKNALELKGFNSVITSFNGQYLGYVIPAKYYYCDHYESRVMGWFGPSMGDYLMELNFIIANSLTGFKL